MSLLLDRTNDYLARIVRLKREDMEGIADCLREHNRLYYQEESPIISDIEYDRLFASLVVLEERYGTLPDSPTSHIRVLLSDQFKKEMHGSPMISLDNTYSVSDLTDFEMRLRRLLDMPDIPIAYIVEPKFDGIGINLCYVHGKLIRALTRGNGREGENITVNTLQIANIPKYIPFMDPLEVRGEVILPHSEFIRINRDRRETGEKLFANTRNAASGSLRQLDFTVTRSRNLRFYAYSCPLLETKHGRQAMAATMETSIETYPDYVHILSRLGFTSTEEMLAKMDSLADLHAYIERENEKKTRIRHDFDTDGLVVKVSRLDIWERAGTTEHHPRYAIAYKFPAQQVRTRVVDILHSVGRSGTVTPVALLEPTAIGGVIIRRATLHNYDELQKKDVRIGDTVWLVRAGEVIPEIVSVVTEARDGSETTVIIPDRCPACSTHLVQDDGRIALYCPASDTCPAQLQGSMEVFVSKHGMDIEGFGKKTIRLFRELGYLTDIVSIFHLWCHREALIALDGWNTLSVDNLLAAIQSRRSIALERLLYGLGIPDVGRKTARTLAQYLAARSTDATSLLETMMTVMPDRLSDIRDIGPISAASIVEFFTENRNMIERLLVEVTPVLNTTTPTSWTTASLSDTSFCITGSFEEYSRDDIIALIENHGGTYRSSITNKLDYLITGESAGSKLKKARVLGVRVILLKEFLEMIGVLPSFSKSSINPFSE